MSSSRLFARSVLQAATRRSSAATQTTMRVSRRAMSSHGGAAKSSDTPWIVASALVFGPAFLYLVSPSAKKNINHDHNDKHDYPPVKGAEAPANIEKDEPPVEIMKDSEGTEANVASSVALSESADVPNDSQGPEKNAELLTQAESDKEPEAQEQSSSTSSVDTSAVEQPSSNAAAKTSTEGSHQNQGEEGPTDQSTTGKQSAQEGVQPKQAAEDKNEN